MRSAFSEGPRSKQEPNTSMSSTLQKAIKSLEGAVPWHEHGHTHPVTREDILVLKSRGFSHRQIAEAVNCSVTTIHRRLNEVLPPRP